MTEEELLASYVGRELHAEDNVDAERLLRLAALLDRQWTPADELPPLAHFVLFRPDQLQSRIGPDGHPCAIRMECCRQLRRRGGCGRAAAYDFCERCNRAAR